MAVVSSIVDYTFKKQQIFLKHNETLNSSVYLKNSKPPDSQAACHMSLVILNLIVTRQYF